MWHEARRQEKVIRTNWVNQKKRAERRRDYYEKIKQDPVKFLRLTGSKMRIYLDSEYAQAADKHMMAWQAQPHIQIDRFDARATLDFYEEVKCEKKKKKFVIARNKAEALEERMCFYERYRCLVQNDFAGLSESQVLRQIDMEEKFGNDDELRRRKDEEDKKKKLLESKAAIGFTYVDSSTTASVSSSAQQMTASFKKVSSAIAKGGTSSTSEDVCDSDSEADSDMDIDVEIRLEELTDEQRKQVLACSVLYGMKRRDFVKLLRQDKATEEAIRSQKCLDEEKAQFAGKKSRRERKAFKEQRLRERNRGYSQQSRSSSSYETGRSLTTNIPVRLSSCSSEFDSDSDNEPLARDRADCVDSLAEASLPRFQFITDFGNTSEEERDKRLRARNVGTSSCTKSIRKSSPILGPELPPHLRPHSSGTSHNHKTSETLPFDAKKLRRSRSRSRSHTYLYNRNRSRGRSISSSLSPPVRRSRRASSSSRGSVSSTESMRKQRLLARFSKAANDLAKSDRNNDDDRDRSNGPQISIRQTKNSSAGAASTESQTRRTYYRRDLENEDKSVARSWASSDSDSDREYTDVRTGQSNAKNVSYHHSQVQAVAALSSTLTTKLTPQEVLKRRMQAALSKTYRADKAAERQKQAKLEQERQDRAEELRVQAELLRKRERERRHAALRAEDDGDGNSSGASASPPAASTSIVPRRSPSSPSSHKRRRYSRSPSSSRDHRRSRRRSRSVSSSTSRRKRSRSRSRDRDWRSDNRSIHSPDRSGRLARSGSDRYEHSSSVEGGAKPKLVDY